MRAEPVTPTEDDSGLQMAVNHVPAPLFDGVDQA